MTELMKATFGRLEPVALREGWTGEASDFTPWLARPDNIALLSEAVGIELEVESQEKNVGPFRADILCRDTLNGHYVLIENQLERTDHIHLGQLLTYAAGLEAVTIVWVAARFTEEHRAALDWLNNATTSEFNFFGLEIELWKIGSSAMAPKFNVVSKPNDWTKTVKEQAAAVQSTQFTESQQKHLDFWTQFRAYLESTGSPIGTNRPSKDHWTNVSVGRSDFSIALFNNFRNSWSGVSLNMTGANAKAHYALIEAGHRAQVDAALTPLGELEWQPKPHAVECAITLWRKVSPADPATWPQLNAWMAAAMLRMNELFRPIVRTLDASEFVTGPTDEPISSDEPLGIPNVDGG